jgi:alpha-beta hydrolase superfamily lysophospholipase
MGGLIVSLYANEQIGNEMFDCVYLNSPFFDMNLNPFLEKCIFPLAAYRGKKKPNEIMQGGVSIAYGKSICVREKGEWNYSLAWKPLSAPDVNLGWLRAIYKAQKQLQRGIVVAKPTLIMHSNQSINSDEWNEQFQISDAVLDVKDIAKYALKIEGNVTIISIQNGMHDLILSRKEVRQNVYNQLFNWLNINL